MKYIVISARFTEDKSHEIFKALASIMHLWEHFESINVEEQKALPAPKEKGTLKQDILNAFPPGQVFTLTDIETISISRGGQKSSAGAMATKLTKEGTLKSEGRGKYSVVE